MEGEIHAFSDDSINHEGIVCAAAVFEAGRLADAQALLNKDKESVGVPADTTLHCRVIFAGDARRGTPWQPVNPQQIFEMVMTLCTELKPVGLRPQVALMDRALIQPQFPAPGMPARIPTDKESASVAYMTVAQQLVIQNPNRRVRIWIDPDSTRIPWGEKRVRADRTRTSVYIDVGPGQEPLKVESQVANVPKPSLLEIADLYAYITLRAHASSGGQRAERFQKLLGIIDPIQWRFEFPSEPQVWTDAKGNPY